MAEDLEISPMEIIRELTTSQLSTRESDRLKEAMAKDDSINSQVFWNVLEESSEWERYTMAAPIDGFRHDHTSKQKKRQVSAGLKQSFAKSKATKIQ